MIDNDDLAKIRHINRDGDMPGFITHVSRGLYEVEGGGAAMAQRLDEICAEVSAAIADGARVIVLSDRHCTAELRADPVVAAHRRRPPPPGPREDPHPGRSRRSRPATSARCTTSRS